MKLFQQLLVAPAALGLLAPLSASASEINLDAISNYSENNLEIDANSFKQQSSNNTLISGGEGLVETTDYTGGFSETTTASFGVDMYVGAEDGADSEAVAFGYQMGIGLETSFTGDDALSATIDIGDGTSGALAFDDTTDVLTLDGLTYTFPVGGTTVMVGDSTDISAVYTGACAYSSFTDYMGNCGTGSTVGLGGASDGVTAAMSYAFDSGFSLAGGVSSPTASILTEEGSDVYGIEAAYTADSWGLAVAYTSNDNAGSAETTYWGVNGNYSFDVADVSVGFETEETSGTDKSGYFVGLTFPEVGPGSVSIGAGTSANYADSETEYMVYEASYSYPVNDGLTITPGVFVEEKSGDDLTGIIVKSSFSF